MIQEKTPQRPTKASSQPGAGESARVGPAPRWTTRPGAAGTDLGATVVIDADSPPSPPPTRADDPVYHNQETPSTTATAGPPQAQARPEKPAAPRPIKINRSAETRAPGKTGINLAIGGAQQPSWPFLMEQNIMPEGRRRMPWRS